MRAVVVGSLNMDLLLGVPELPSRGQTLLSYWLDRSPGGKGANQAVALARLDAQVDSGRGREDNDGADKATTRMTGFIRSEDGRWERFEELRTPALFRHRR
jgi:hypothetical protein